MATFATQNGDGREYSASGYNTAQAAGGQRSSPNRAVVGAGLSAMRPGGYVPTYAKYAKPAMMPVTPVGGPDAASVSSAAPNASRATAVTMAPYQSGRAAGEGAPAGFLGGDFGNFQGALSGAMKGYADMAGQDFQKQVGSLLGNLNSIGALRSGGVQAGISDAMQNYGREVGDYSSMLAGKAADLAQSQYTYDQQESDKQQQYSDAKKAAHKSAIGKIIGGLGDAASHIPGIGTVAGGILSGIGSMF